MWEMEVTDRDLHQPMQDQMEGFDQTEQDQMEEQSRNQHEDGVLGCALLNGSYVGHRMIFLGREKGIISSIEVFVASSTGPEVKMRSNCGINQERLQGGCSSCAQHYKTV